MNPLLKKEIRLILPAWSLALLLAVAPAMLIHQSSGPFDLMMPLWFGILLLCASSFGREFSLGTFSTMLAQPVPRRQYWFVKVGVLVAALLLSLLACFLSLVLFQVVFVGDSGPTALTVGLFLLAAVAGGLWLALVVRQMVAVVWLIVLFPLVLCVPALLVLFHFDATDKMVENTLDTVLLVYAVAGIAGSWLIFRQAQDAPWSGGTISLPDWMPARPAQSTATSTFQRPPLWVLIRKEFHFNQAPLLGMGAFWLLHLGAVGLRYLHWHPTDLYWRDINDALQSFGVLWVIAPLVIGGTSIAEERKWGTMEGQLCLPVSSRHQFLIKLSFVTILGGLLSSALCLGAERLGLALGLTPGLILSEPGAAVVAGLTAVALVSFFASSLTCNILQALPATIAVILGIAAVFAGFNQISGFGKDPLIPGVVLWNPILPALLAAVMLMVVLPWLAYRNFRCLHETGRIWRRNGLTLAAVLVLAMSASVVIFHRAWEKLTPLEPAHGPALWALNQAPVAGQIDLYNNLLFTRPDGRSWFGCLTYPQPASRWSLWDYLRRPAAPQLGAQQVIPGSNWVSLAAGGVDLWITTNHEALGEEEPVMYQHAVGGRETVGIRADGTLWVSAKPARSTAETNAMVQYGSESNWLQVLGERSLTSVLLLKKDGTLWRWGDGFHNVSAPTNWPGLRATPPQRIGTNTDWQGLAGGSWPLGQKKNGSLWILEIDSQNGATFTSYTNMAQAGFEHQRLTATQLAYTYNVAAGIRQDGTLWIWGNNLDWGYVPPNKKNVHALPCSPDTNWVAVALDSQKMVALKSDGTLWKWGPEYGAPFHQFSDEYTRPPRRLGIHQDWVALAQTWFGVVTLAADGSLWLWVNDDDYRYGTSRLISPSQKPVALGNVLAANRR